MAITQARAAGAFTGRRYGSFAGRGEPHPVDVLTQPTAGAAHTMRRYGSFAGRVVVTPGPGPAPGPQGGSMRMRLPRELVEAQRARRITEDDVLLLLAASIAAGIVH